MGLLDKAEVYFFSTGSESWLHKSCLVKDVGLQLSSLPEVRQRQQHYSLLLSLAFVTWFLTELFYPLLPLPAKHNFSWSLSIKRQQWELPSKEMSWCSPAAKWSGRAPEPTLGIGLPRVCWWGVNGHHWKCVRPKNRTKNMTKSPGLPGDPCALALQLWTGGFQLSLYVVCES